MAYILKALGLSTFDNELENRDGDLFVADNVVIDADNIIESRRGFNDYGDNFPTEDDRAKQLLLYKNRILRHYNSIIQFDSNGSGSFSDFSGSYNELENKLRIKYQEVIGNLYFTTDSGIKKISALNADDFTTDSGFITDAGGVKALDIDATIVPSDGGFLTKNSKTAYRVLWSITDKNNNQTPGTPSSRIVVSNPATDTIIPEIFTVTVTGALTATEYILASTSTNDYYFWFNVTGSDSEPQTAETVNRIGVEINLVGASSNDDRAEFIGNAISDIAGFDVLISTNIVTVNIETIEVGGITPASEQSGGTTNLTLSVSQTGSNTTGLSSNVEVNFTVPESVTTTDYFYQLYRTQNASVVEGLTLNDIDPGDEMNLVYESGITEAQIIAGEITYTDDTPEDFRASGTPLYTNPNTGEGILQANDRPPIARDIELFRNVMFYANTKTAHRKQINLLSVSGMVSGSTEFIIGDSTITRNYTFVGEKQVQRIDTSADSSDSLDGTYFLINSSRNKRKYYVWFSTGAGASDPAISGRLPIEVKINTNETADNIALLIETALEETGDFDISISTNEVTITWGKNGKVDDSTDGTTGFTFNAPTTDGDGEDSSLNNVLLSSLASVGQSIDETARSLVRVINKDSDSPVYAFYLSGPNDLPGIIFFESRSLNDVEFYFGTNDSNVTTDFNPELPLATAISSITFSSGSNSPANINDPGHGLVNGQEIYIYDTASNPSILGKYKITLVDVNNFTVPVDIIGEDNPSSAMYFKSDVDSDNEVVPNRVYFSKNNRPEAVPLLNFIDVGRKDKIIHRIIALRDNLFVLKEDGTFIITGSTSPNFGSRLVDASTIIIAPDTAQVLNNQIYFLSNQGVVKVSESGGANVISRRIEDKITKIANNKFNFKNESFGISYETDRSYILFMPTETSDSNATQAYRYNTFTNTWTRWIYNSICGVVNTGNDKLYIGQGDRNYIQQERKCLDRTDYSDRDFLSTVSPLGVITNNTIKINDTSQVDQYDIFTQTQYVTISNIKRFLTKLDKDFGLNDTDYISLLPTNGGNMKIALDSINAKLLADDSSGTVTSRVYSTNFETQKNEFNLLIGELNDAACDTSFKDYRTVDYSVTYEAVINSVTSIDNTIELNLINLPILEGESRVYKHIPKTVEWMPVHFGDPSATKQIRESSIIFDQNNFYGGKIAFNSDLSQDFDEVDFNGRGVGFWGGNNWGESSWGGLGSEVPLRTYLPSNKQRARYIRIRIKHFNGREIIRILGISLEPRLISKRGYR